MKSLMRYINRTARCFTLYRNNELEEEGINGYQHLYIIKICTNPGISQDELAREIYVNKSSVARQCSLLEQNGLIRRESCPQDRRQLNIYPTQKALDLYPKVLAVRAHWNQRLLENFTDEEQQQLLGMMERVMQQAVCLLESLEEGSGGR